MTRKNQQVSLNPSKFRTDTANSCTIWDDIEKFDWGWGGGSQVTSLREKCYTSTVCSHVSDRGGQEPVIYQEKSLP